VIILYVHALAATGVVRNVRIIAAGLTAKGHDVRLVTALPGGDSGDIPHDALLKAAGPSRVAEKLHAALALRRYLRRRRPVILISAGNHDHVVAWSASRGMPRLKRIYRISNDLVRAVPGAPGGLLKRQARSIMAGLIAADADHIVLVSPSLRDTPAFRTAAQSGRVTVIANGIDSGAARRRAEGPAPHVWMGQATPTILAIGRLAPQKNFETLLDAFALVHGQQPVRLIILGESRDRAHRALFDQARRLGVADDLALPGIVPNVFPWLAHADAFVLPSWWEGSANVLLEAMAADVPVVASRTAGNASDLLDDDRYGLLVDPADAGALARALAQQIDKDRAIRPGDRIAGFNLDGMADAWGKLVGADDRKSWMPDADHVA
jgi:glycosyltransferase involved in cell wall biosynthesis